MVCGFTSTRNNRLISARRIVDSVSRHARA
jgi:hypothetical protein